MLLQRWKFVAIELEVKPCGGRLDLCVVVPDREAKSELPRDARKFWLPRSMKLYSTPRLMLRVSL
jgi:hypothetical protein